MAIKQYGRGKVQGGHAIGEVLSGEHALGLNPFITTEGGHTTVYIPIEDAATFTVLAHGDADTLDAVSKMLAAAVRFARDGADAEDTSGEA